MRHRILFQLMLWVIITAGVLTPGFLVMGQTTIKPDSTTIFKLNGDSYYKWTQKHTKVPDEIRFGYLSGATIGKEIIDDSTSQINRQVYYFEFGNNVPENSEFLSAKLEIEISTASGNQIIRITSMSSYSKGSNSESDWFNKIKNGTVIDSVDIGSGTTLSITNNALDNQVKAAILKTSNRYFTIGVTTKAEDVPVTIYSCNLFVKYKSKYNVVVKNSFNSGFVYVTGYGIPNPKFASGATLPLYKSANYNLSAVNDTLINGITWVFETWTNGTENKFQNPFLLSPSKNETWTAKFAEKIKITFKNEEGVSNLPNSKLILGTSDTIPSGSYRLFTKNSQNTIKTSQQTLDNKRIQHNNWNDVKSSFRLSKTFTATTDTVTRSAKFLEIKPVTVSLSLDGIPVIGPIQVKDPWSADSDTNWKSYQSGFTPATIPNGGVFLGEGGNDVTNPKYPYYSTRITNSQTTLAGTDAYFSNWSGPAGSVASPTSLETAVIFKSANDVIKANYKGHLRTGNPSNYAKNQNRMVIQSTANQPSILVYDSMNEIWLTHQDEGELLWSKELKLSGTSGAAGNPSISNEIQVASTDYHRFAVSWVESGKIHIQLVKSNRFGGGDFTYGWSAGENDQIQDETNHLVLVDNLVDKFGVPLASARPVVNLSYYPNDTAPTSLILTVAYEGKTSSSATTTTIIENELVFQVTVSGSPGNVFSYINPFFTYNSWSGNLYRALTTEKVSGYPVVIRYNARGANPAKHAVYYLASTGSGTTLTKLVEHNLETGVNTAIMGLYYVRSFNSLSGNCNYTSGGIVLSADVTIYDYHNPSNPYYDKPTCAVYVKTVSSASTPALSKTYTNYRGGVVMVDQGAIASLPVYELNMLPVSGTQWAKATGGTTVTYIQGSSIVQPFVSGRVPAGTRKSVVVKSGSPAMFLNYGGSGVLNKGGGTVADVRAFRTIGFDNGEQKQIILDFTGTQVEPVDSLETGAVVCAVEFISESVSTILVSQPDSLLFPLGVNIIRNGISIRSYKAGLWNSLSSHSFEDLQRGDILAFRTDSPVSMIVNYEEFNVSNTDMAEKSDSKEETGDKLKSVTTGVAVYPNPFNPNTSISVSLEAPASVKVMVYNILGQLVSDFGKTDLGAGVHNYAFDGKTLASGTYFYRVEIGEKVKTGKLQLLK